MWTSRTVVAKSNRQGLQAQLWSLVSPGGITVAGLGRFPFCVDSQDLVRPSLMFHFVSWLFTFYALFCNVSILLCCFLCCFVAMSLVLRFAKDIRISSESWLRSNLWGQWVSGTGRQLFDSGVQVSQRSSPEFCSKLPGRVGGCTAWVSYWCCSEDLETTTGYYWYVWYVLMLLMQSWQMLRGNWTCSFPMVSLCQRLWASLNLTILIYLNHFDHTCP